MDSRDFEEFCYNFMILQYELSLSKQEPENLAYNKGLVNPRAAFERAYHRFNREFKPNAKNKI